MAKKMSEIAKKDPSIWQRISSGVSDFFKPKEKTEDQKLAEIRAAQGEYEAQQAKKLEEMRSGEEEYAQRQRQKLAEQEYKDYEDLYVKLTHTVS